MSVFAAVILCVGLVLEVCLIAVLLWKGLWRCYPYFSFLVLFIVVRSLLWFIFPLSEYADFYWKTDMVDVVLRFLVVWEVFRHIFPRSSALNVLFSRGFAVVIAGLVMLAVGTVWSYHTYSSTRSVATALERSFSFTQAVLILGLLLAARSYGLPLGRHLHGISVAFGVWASLSTANNAMYDLMHSFLPYWQLLRPLSFVALLAVWTWALWKGSPISFIADQPVPAAALDTWTENWNRTQTSLRKVKPS